MIYFARSGFRSFTSLASVLLLLLIIYLLLLDPPDRRPFVERLVLQAVGLVETICGQTRQAIEDDSTGPAEAQDHDAKAITGQMDNDRFTNTANPRLPVDFQVVLEEAARASSDASCRDHFDRIVRENDPATKRRLAIQLAYELPGEWWPVNGKWVHQLDLALLLHVNDFTPVPQHDRRIGSGQ